MTAVTLTGRTLSMLVFWVVGSHRLDL